MNLRFKLSLSLGCEVMNCSTWSYFTNKPRPNDFLKKSSTWRNLREGERRVLKHFCNCFSLLFKRSRCSQLHCKLHKCSPIALTILNCDALIWKALTYATKLNHTTCFGHRLSGEWPICMWSPYDTMPCS